MSLINTYVSISQFCRRLAAHIRNKLIDKLQVELLRTEVALADAEEKRSAAMVSLHNDHYAAVAALEKEKEEAWVKICNKYEAKLTAELNGFTMKRASVAVVSQAVADDLKSRRAALSSELDKLIS